jgi:hypothetical protein
LVSWLVFYLLLAGKGDAPPDFVTLIDADDYFRARQIVASAERMEVLAQTEPTDGPRQIAQLLAIRWLGDHRMETARATLTRIGEGRLAQDKHGFARDHARRALAQLYGEPPARLPAPGTELRETLAWFPRDATTILALDLGTPWANKPFSLKGVGSAPSSGGPQTPFLLRPALLTAAHEGDFYRWSERVGNVEFDRVAAAVLPPARPGGTERRLLRVTGRGNWSWLITSALHEESFSPAAQDALIRWEREPSGEPITLFLAPESRMALAIVGTTDLIVASDPDGSRDAMELVEQALQARAAGPGGLSRGSLRADLEQIPEDAAAFCVGALPEDLQQGLSGEGGLPAMPRRLIAYATVGEGRAVTLRIRAQMDTPEKAQALVEAIRGWRERQLAEVEKLRTDHSAEALIQMLESITAEAQDTSVRGEARASGAFPEALGDFVELWVGHAVGALVGGVLALAFQTLLIVLCVAVGVIILIVFMLAMLVILVPDRKRTVGR